MVTSPTRSKNIIDKMFTDCSNYHSVPVVLPLAKGKSDHNIIFLSGIEQVKSRVGCQVVTRRQLAEDLENFTWLKLYYLNDSRKPADLFYAMVFDIINKYARMRLIKFNNNA
jgi:hypothetical protein